MSWVAVGVTALNAGSSIVSKRQAKKDAKNQRIKNEKIERMNNILDVLGGGSAGGFNSNQQAITGSTFADILSGAGSIGQAAGSAIHQKAQDEIAKDEVAARQLLRDQQILESKSRVDARKAQSAMAQMEQLFNISNSGLNGKTSSGGGKGLLGTSRWGIDKGVLPNMNASFFPGQGVN